jgi:SpoVK/Ycf46/Vps4 family AAA+-type ATPase
LSENDIIELGNLTDGYSGSDISILVRDAVYEPVRKLQTSKKFKVLFYIFLILLGNASKWRNKTYSLR